MKRYNKAIDYALLAMHYARKAELAKSTAVKAAMRKKSIQAALMSGKQTDTLAGIKTLEASLRLAAENESMPFVEEDIEDSIDVEAEDDMLEDDMSIEEVDAEADENEDEDEDDVIEDVVEEDEDEDEDEAVEAFNRLSARVRARHLAARRLAARRMAARRLAARSRNR